MEQDHFILSSVTGYRMLCMCLAGNMWLYCFCTSRKRHMINRMEVKMDTQSSEEFSSEVEETTDSSVEEPQKEKRKKYYSPNEVMKRKGCIGCSGGAGIFAILIIILVLVAVLH